MERKSKEEILEKHFPTPEDHSDTSAILNAIQQYTDQEMALFAEWKENYRFKNIGISNVYMWVTTVKEYSGQAYTTQQLLTIYKKEQDGI